MAGTAVMMMMMLATAAGTAVNDTIRDGSPHNGILIVVGGEVCQGVEGSSHGGGVGLDVEGAVDFVGEDIVAAAAAAAAASGGGGWSGRHGAHR